MRFFTLLLLLILSVPAVAQTAAQGTAEGAGGDVGTLIRILENDETRAKLIEELRRVDGGAAAATDPAAADSAGVLQIGEYTRAAVESSADLVAAVVRGIKQAAGIFSGTSTLDAAALWNAIRNVLIVAAVTFAVFFVLRLGFQRAQRIFAAAAQGQGPVRRAGIIGVSAVADMATVLLAWAAGYVPALYLGWGDHGGQSQTFFLGAFLWIELAKVAARVALAPRWPALRFLRMGDTTAAYWYFWASRILSVVGYTFLFIAPILAANASHGAAQALRAFVLFCTLAMACIIIMQNRDRVRAWLTRQAERFQSEVVVRSLSILARFWNVVAIGYLVLIFTLWLADEEAALPFVLAATVQSLMAIAIGVALTVAVVRVASAGMHLPADIRGRLPLLEQRLNAFVPNVLRVVRGVILAGVVISIAQIWRLADVMGWVSSDFGQRVVTAVISAGIILLVGGLIHLAVQSWVEYRLDPPKGRKPTARERTLLSLFRNAFTIALSVLVLMLVLSELGVNIAPLLAGAGILGLAVGFGAQKLVQDIITGAFIQFENAMNEGDVVTVGGITGTVEKLTIRSVSLRTLDGAYHLIPFSSVDSVSNFMKSFGYHVAEIGVDYGVSIPEVKLAMQEAFERLKQGEHGEHILGDLEMHGITQFGDSAIMVRARIKTRAGQQWAVGRHYNEIIKEVFDERRIDIPFPHMTLHLDEDDRRGLALASEDKLQAVVGPRRPPARERPALTAKRLRAELADQEPAVGDTPLAARA
ncbi:mechanosensitive ion channel domain-containing protein [Chelativorans sp.]|uniref:mechanosensitive ion channel domain-containing protein n=1 Tax=Chelativorans sp. TaxID=2203393 RepID=UPI0028116398|nr:mechanosensitive ion channel domain-containing protein [Chelativorans sp.]